VTDRKALALSSEEQIRALLEKIEIVGRSGVDWIQIREKDLSGRELAALVTEAVRHVPPGCRILVNDRPDVAIACGAHGVHLGAKSVPLEEAKRFTREKHLGGDFSVGVSTHSMEDVRAAEKSGADYAIFGPVYETPSKAAFGEPQGIGRLAEICRIVSIPVIAIGGITANNGRECIAGGASGIAAIRMFQDAADLAKLLRTLREG
jgi:thiamine-phosphate pyrophosphorylase